MKKQVAEALQREAEGVALDMLALAAMQGLVIAHPDLTEPNAHFPYIAERAYDLAEAMMRESEKRGQQQAR